MVSILAPHQEGLSKAQGIRKVWLSKYLSK